MAYWMLQAKPEIYDARAALGDVGSLDRWRIARYRDDIAPGDEFALWISGRESGVYAFGVVTGPVVRDEDPDPLWQDPADGAALGGGVLACLV
jgi:hypothetical protein